MVHWPVLLMHAVAVQICPEMQVAEMHAPYDKHHKVSSSLKSHQNTHTCNRPFYSCVLSYLAMNASEAGVELALIQTSLLFSCKCQLVSIRKT